MSSALMSQFLARTSHWTFIKHTLLEGMSLVRNKIHCCQHLIGREMRRNMDGSHGTYGPDIDWMDPGSLGADIMKVHRLSHFDWL